MRLLYAEDFQPMAEIVCLGLARAGYHVRHASDGQKALSDYLQNPAQFDLLITDHDMPAMSGLELLRSMRTKGFAGHALVNGGSLGESVESAYRTHGPVTFVGKPARVAQLLEIIDQIPVLEPRPGAPRLSPDIQLEPPRTVGPLGPNSAIPVDSP